MRSVVDFAANPSDATLTIMAAIAELVSVRLRHPHGRWPAGACGVVVNYRPGWPVATVDFSELVPLAERAAIDFFELVREVDGGSRAR